MSPIWMGDARGESSKTKVGFDNGENNAKHLEKGASSSRAAQEKSHVW